MLADKKLLITGVITRDSIAWEVARQAQEAGAEVVLTGFGRAKRMTERAAAKLPQPVDVLDLDAQVAWPVYDWMGVAKAGLEAVSRYLARDLGPKGVRVNLVSAGPLGTLAANGIPGFDDLAKAWEQQAPLGWDTEDAGPVA